MPRAAGSVSSSDTDHLDAKEAKKQRRLIRNRLSAQLHRERQRAYMSGLQHQVAALTAERDVWRDAFDSVLARCAAATGQDPVALLEGIPLPVAAEQVAPPPAAPSGQATRNPDGSDVMAELMDKARGQVVPRSKAVARSLAGAAAARAVTGIVASVEADSSRRGRRRPSKRAAEDGSPTAGGNDTDRTLAMPQRGMGSESDWGEAAPAAKRPATGVGGPAELLEPDARLAPPSLLMPGGPEEHVAAAVADGLADLAKVEDPADLADDDEAEAEPIFPPAMLVDAPAPVSAAAALRPPLGEEEDDDDLFDPAGLLSPPLMPRQGTVDSLAIE